MKKLLTILCLVLLTSCGPSQEEQQQAELEQQRLEKEASEKLAQETSRRIAAVTCAVMQETLNMDAAVRVREMNEAREKIGGEPFLSGDDAIKEAFEFGLCQELVLDENYYESLQPLKDAMRERERIAAEKRAEEQRIADSKPIVKEEFYSSRQPRTRTTYHSKNDGGVSSGRHGLYESFYENGQLDYRGNYKNGKKEGLWESYYTNGQFRRKENYKDGKQHGLHEVFYENGQLLYRRNYKNGEYHGLWEFYHTNGQLGTKGNIKNNKEQGLWEYYDRDGNPTKTEEWKDGELTE